MGKKLLTVFTPTYNRLNTIKRTYKSLQGQTNKNVDWLIIDDGSSDGIRDWVYSLGKIIELTGSAFDWMGLPTGMINEDHFVIYADSVRIEYVYKPNGGLYSGYNVAFALIQSELCVCIDSDDYLPENAVEIITNKWNNLTDIQQKQIGGIVGLDYNVVDNKPIGGFFKTESPIACIFDLKHKGDCKYVFRTELIRRFSPQIGFEGEKDFNPHYMQMQLLDKYPMLIINESLCWVDYQNGDDSMSQSIYKQYLRSPKSFAKYRLQELKITHGNNIWKKVLLSAHYVSSCIISRDKEWLKKASNKYLTIISSPIGVLICLYIHIRKHLK